jgi:hypothetical protein
METSRLRQFRLKKGERERENASVYEIITQSFRLAGLSNAFDVYLTM